MTDNQEESNQQSLDAFADADSDDSDELPPCPWCYSSSETFSFDGPAREGVSCICGAVIPINTDWYQAGKVVGIDV